MFKDSSLGSQTPGTKNQPLPHSRNLVTDLLREGAILTSGKQGKKSLYKSA